MTDANLKGARIAEDSGMAEELIRVGPGECSGPRRASGPGAILVVVDGTGSALAGDVWLEVGPGDRIEVDGGDPCALRADRSGPVVGVVLAGRAAAVRAA